RAPGAAARAGARSTVKEFVIGQVGDSRSAAAPQPSPGTHCKSGATGRMAPWRRRARRACDLRLRPREEFSVLARGRAQATALAGRGPGPRVDCAPRAPHGNTAAPGECSAASRGEAATAMQQVPVGRVVGTERRPNTPHEFHFWTAEQSAVGIGALVRVDVGGAQPRRVYGVVVDGASYTDLETPLHDYIGLEGDPASAAPAPTERPEIRLYTAAVLRHEPAEPLQPVPAGPVYLATDEDVRVALRMDAYARPDGTAIPVGLYTTGGLEAPIYLDADFLLGPEAAHLNITGVSGLATKTSAVLFLLASIFEHLPRSKGSVAALCFNVKGPDLLFLDQPGELTDEDRRMYERLRVPAEPFKDVH